MLNLFPIIVCSADKSVKDGGRFVVIMLDSYCVGICLDFLNICPYDISFGYISVVSLFDKMKCMSLLSLSFICIFIQSLF